MKNIKMEWIPVTMRKATEAERKRLAELFCLDPEDLDSNRLIFSSPMPEDEQEILISTAYGVAIDRCLVSETGTGLDERGDWDGVLAWMPLPDPYKDPLDHCDEAIRCKAEGCSPEGCKHCDHYEPIDFGGDDHEID